MNNPAGLVWIAPLAWGLYKCSTLASRPATSKKAVHALAVMLGVWLLLFVILAVSGVPEASAQLLFALAVLFAGGPLAASVLAVLGLLEIRKAGRAGPPIRLQGKWQAAGAIALAGALLVPVAIYTGAAMLGRRSAQVAPPDWVSFTSPQGDFEIQFPGAPETTAASPAAGGDAPLDAGRATGRIFTASHGPAIFGLTVRDDPAATVAGAEAVFDAWEKSIAQRLPGQVTERSHDASPGMATREIRGVSPARSTAYRFRAVAVEGHLYMLAATMPEGGGEGPVADRFFQSFTLRPAKPAR